MLTLQQIEFYREQGYLLVEDVIDPALLTRLRDAAEAMIEQSRAVSESDAVFDLDEGHSAATPRLTRVKHPHLNVPGFDEVLHAPKIKAPVRSRASPKRGAFLRPPSWVER